MDLIICSHLLIGNDLSALSLKITFENFQLISEWGVAVGV